MPPSSAVTSMYLPCPTAHLVRSRQVSELVNADASGPGDLDDPLDADVPDRHVVEQRPVLLDRVGVVARQVHVVVDVVGAAAGLEGLLEERRAPVPRAEIEGRRRGRRGRSRAAGHRERTSWTGSRDGRPRDFYCLSRSIRRTDAARGQATSRRATGRQPQLHLRGAGRPAHDILARDRRPVGHDLQRQPVEQRQDPPRGAGRVRAAERRRGHARADRPLQQPLPLEVEPPRGRLERRPARRLRPGVEPELERPVLVGGRVGPEEDPQRLDRVAGLPHQPAETSRSWLATRSNAAASTSSIESK